MATQVRFRRGTTAEHSSFAGAAGEMTIDTDKHVCVVHDGSTNGGVPLAKESDITTLEGADTTLQNNIDALKKFNLQMTLVEGDDLTFTLLQSAYFGFTIEKAYFQTSTGTVSAAVKIGGTDVTGLGSLAFSSTEGNATATAAKTVAVGDKVEVTFSSNSAAEMVSISLDCERT